MATYQNRTLRVTVPDDTDLSRERVLSCAMELIARRAASRCYNDNPQRCKIPSVVALDHLEWAATAVSPLAVYHARHADGRPYWEVERERLRGYDQRSSEARALRPRDNPIRAWGATLDETDRRAPDWDARVSKYRSMCDQPPRLPRPVHEAQGWTIEVIGEFPAQVGLTKAPRGYVRNFPDLGLC